MVTSSRGCSWLLLRRAGDGSVDVTDLVRRLAAEPLGQRACVVARRTSNERQSGVPTSPCW